MTNVVHVSDSRSHVVVKAPKINVLAVLGLEHGHELGRLAGRVERLEAIDFGSQPVRLATILFLESGPFLHEIRTDVVDARVFLALKPRQIGLALLRLERGAFGLGEEGDLAPGRQGVQALLVFALLQQIMRMHVGAEGAAVQLRHAQEHQFQQLQQSFVRQNQQLIWQEQSQHLKQQKR